MSALSRLGRPMLGSMFIAGGVDQLLNPDEKTEAARRVQDVADDKLEDNPLPDDPSQVVRINGAIQVAAGSLLALNKMPRLAALALVGSLVPTTLASHRFWEEDDPADAKAQRTQFLKNVAMLGGLLVVADDQGSRPTMTWRARRALSRGSSAAPSAADVAGALTTAFSAATSAASAGASAAADAAKSTADTVAPVVKDTVESAKPVVTDVVKAAGPAVRDAVETAKPVVSETVRTVKPKLTEAYATARPVVTDAVRTAKPKVVDVSNRVVETVGARR